MDNIFTEHDYEYISNIVFRDNFPGYKPNVTESPNGDGKWDTEKKYAHVAMKYLEKYQGVESTILEGYLNECNRLAVEVAIKLGIPKVFWPRVEYSALRILEYPPGAITNEHTDFDLFTLMCYRNITDAFQYLDEVNTNQYWNLEDAKHLNHQIHFGEILEIINPKAYKATKHQVIADPQGRTQYSIVYFAIPNHEAKLPTGETVLEWLNERMARSRSYA